MELRIYEIGEYPNREYEFVLYSEGAFQDTVPYNPKKSIFKIKENPHFFCIELDDLLTIRKGLKKIYQLGGIFAREYNIQLSDEIYKEND